MADAQTLGRYKLQRKIGSGASVPSGITGVEQRAVQEAAEYAAQLAVAEHPGDQGERRRQRVEEVALVVGRQVVVAVATALAGTRSTPSSVLMSTGWASQPRRSTTTAVP